MPDVYFKLCKEWDNRCWERIFSSCKRIYVMAECQAEYAYLKKFQILKTSFYKEDFLV